MWCGKRSASMMSIIIRFGDSFQAPGTLGSIRYASFHLYPGWCLRESPSQTAVVMPFPGLSNSRPFHWKTASSDITGQLMPSMISDLRMAQLATSVDQFVPWKMTHDHDPSWPSGVDRAQPRGAGVASKGFWEEYRWWSLSCCKFRRDILQSQAKIKGEQWVNTDVMTNWHPLCGCDPPVGASLLYPSFHFHCAKAHPTSFWNFLNPLVSTQKGGKNMTETRNQEI